MNNKNVALLVLGHTVLNYQKKYRYKKEFIDRINDGCSS